MPAEEEAKEKAKLLEASLEEKVGPSKWLASLVKAAHRLKEVLLGDKREPPSFDYHSRYMVVFTEPCNLKLESEKYGFDSFLHQILNDGEKLALVVPPNAVASVLETTARIVGSEADTQNMRIVAVNYWRSFYEKEQVSRPTFKRQAKICEDCLKSLAKFQDDLKTSPDLLYNYQLRKGTSLSEKFGPELEKIRMGLEELKSEVTRYHQMQQEANDKSFPKSVNLAPYIYQPQNQFFDLMFGIWEIIRPYECHTSHVHHLARATERWRLYKKPDDWILDTNQSKPWEKNPEKEWRFDDFKAAVGWRKT